MDFDFSLQRRYQIGTSWEEDISFSLGRTPCVWREKKNGQGYLLRKAGVLDPIFVI